MFYQRANSGHSSLHFISLKSHILVSIFSLHKFNSLLKSILYRHLPVQNHLFMFLLYYLVMLTKKYSLKAYFSLSKKQESYLSMKSSQLKATCTIKSFQYRNYISLDLQIFSEVVSMLRNYITVLKLRIYFWGLLLSYSHY